MRPTGLFATVMNLSQCRKCHVYSDFFVFPHPAKTKPYREPTGPFATVMNLGSKGASGWAEARMGK